MPINASGSLGFGGAMASPQGGGLLDPNMLMQLLGGGGGGGLLGSMLLNLGAGIAGGSTQGWGPGIGQGLQLAGQARDSAEDRQLKKLLFASQLAPKSTDDMREFEEAKRQGFKGNFLDYQKEVRRSGATNVTVGGGRFGTIPPGFELIEGPEGTSMRPIPGGPAAAEFEAAERKRSGEQSMQARTADIVTEDVGRAKSLIKSSEFPTTGLVGALTQSVPGTPSHNLQQVLTTVKANISFDKLQAMRAASPTGGALGQVSDFENRLLQSTFGALEQSQTKEQLEFNLDRVKELYLDIIHGPGNRPSAKTSTPSQPVGQVLDFNEFFGR